MEGAKRKFGTVGAIAFAFIGRFQPQRAVPIRKSANNSDRKSKCSAQPRLISRQGGAGGSSSDQPPATRQQAFPAHNIEGNNTNLDFCKHMIYDLNACTVVFEELKVQGRQVWGS
ncbi:hypothetical protein BK146_23245 [Paenibacillus sp. FSL R7-0333]|nr:hypothetical protein BK146_23245 [Paenibacillus sp. FSL R7-0333]